MKYLCTSSSSIYWDNVNLVIFLSILGNIVSVANKYVVTSSSHSWSYHFRQNERYYRLSLQIFCLLSHSLLYMIYRLPIRTLFNNILSNPSYQRYLFGYFTIANFWHSHIFVCITFGMCNRTSKIIYSIC